MINDINLENYDKYIVAFSGGKDSIATFLWLLDQGIDRSKIELWHHLVDGPNSSFMDWPITESYCRAFGKAFNVPVYMSWKEGGFEREMNRDNQPTAPINFEYPDQNGNIIIGVTGGNGPDNTRLKFPQVSPDLRVRWCSAYLKIDVCAAAIRNQKRFQNKKILLLSGERGEESAARAKYKIHEPDRSDLRNGKKFTRLVDRLRPVKDWLEGSIWEIIKKHNVRVHPCYYLGWSRCSCLFCIFGNKDQFASANALAPDQSNRIINKEENFGLTIKRNISLIGLISKGSVYDSIYQTTYARGIEEEYKDIAMSTRYDLPIFFDENEKWFLPAGAFGEGCGPT